MDLLRLLTGSDGGGVADDVWAHCLSDFSERCGLHNQGSRPHDLSITTENSTTSLSIKKGKFFKTPKA